MIVLSSFGENTTTNNDDFKRKMTNTIIQSTYWMLKTMVIKTVQSHGVSDIMANILYSDIFYFYLTKFCWLLLFKRIMIITQYPQHNAHLRDISVGPLVGKWMGG